MVKYDVNFWHDYAAAAFEMRWPISAAGWIKAYRENLHMNIDTMEFQATMLIFGYIYQYRSERKFRWISNRISSHSNGYISKILFIFQIIQRWKIHWDLETNYENNERKPDR